MAVTAQPTMSASPRKDLSPGPVRAMSDSAPKPMVYTNERNHQGCGQYECMSPLAMSSTNDRDEAAQCALCSCDKCDGDTGTFDESRQERNHVECSATSCINEGIAGPGFGSHSVGIKSKRTEYGSDLAPGNKRRRNGCLLRRDEEAVDPYQVLQLRRDATATEIRNAYRRAALFHHPGRLHGCSIEERQHNYHQFVSISACYETLMCDHSRKEYDSLGCDVENEPQFSAGHSLHGGGLRVVRTLSVATSTYSNSKSLITMAEDDTDDEVEGASPTSSNPSDRDTTLPSLSRASSYSSSSEEDPRSFSTFATGSESGRMPLYSCVVSGVSAVAGVGSLPTSNSPRENPSGIPGLSASSSDGEAEVHFTEKDTQRLFGGPLSMLFRARKWEPFTDPFDLFQNVFGSQIYQKPSQGELIELSRTVMHLPLPGPAQPSSSVWHGSSRRSKDGATTVLTTSRILHQRRRLTRTETVQVHPATGIAHSRVDVTGEDIDDAAECQKTISSPRSPRPSQSSCLFGGLCDDVMCGEMIVFYKDLCRAQSVSWADFLCSVRESSR